MRFLIVEDVEVMRELLRQVIETGGVDQVSGTAQNGAEARLELMRRRPDAVLLDEVLPGESSFDLLEELRLDGMPVVLLTSLPDRTPQQVPLPPGALGRLLKPEWKTFDQDSPRFVRELGELLR